MVLLTALAAPISSVSSASVSLEPELLFVCDLVRGNWCKQSKKVEVVGVVVVLVSKVVFSTEERSFEGKTWNP